MPFLLLHAFLMFQAERAGATELIGWGNNAFGQLDMPSGSTNVVSIAAGYDFSLALTEDGRVVSWGASERTQIHGVPQGLTNIVAISAFSSNRMALTADGQVVVWGDPWIDPFLWDPKPMPTDLTNIVAIAAGAEHCIALRTDGSLATWGSNPRGSIDPPRGLSNVVAISAGYLGYCMALTASGEVITWGDMLGIPSPPSNMSNAVAIKAGYFWGVTVSADGTVNAWFSPLLGENPLLSISNVVDASLGDCNAVLLLNDGEIAQWGCPTASVPAGLSNVVAVASGYNYNGQGADWQGQHNLALIDRTGSTRWRLAPPRVTTDGLDFEIPTQRGHLYVIESRNSLQGDQWRVVRRIAGDGSIKRFTTGPADQVFFRGRRL